MSDTQGTPALKKTSRTLPWPESHSTPKSQGASFQLNTSTRTEEFSSDHTEVERRIRVVEQEMRNRVRWVYVSTNQRRALRFEYLYSIGMMHLETLECCVIQAMARYKMSFSVLVANYRSR
ncbi:uncharacterized protein CIMG_02539 [Coccidioides immitis RS]|uniref:Uncharacterized protein n=1 Tax=Coccidioides immitis (strain RS) TaxID=246410 RepID=J3KLK9_COCIM|nr:uncharacterized protein CIMG_02539 [Coccidioides immitis RS]EAS37185.3 hypothetical protein CIMG_02539 [Coccidioides immitis RS]